MKKILKYIIVVPLSGLLVFVLLYIVGHLGLLIFPDLNPKADNAELTTFQTSLIGLVIMLLYSLCFIFYHLLKDIGK